MPTRREVLRALRTGGGPEEAARELGIPPGLVYMIATGRPADGKDTDAAEGFAPDPDGPPSTQHLVNPPAHNPTRDERVLEWLRARARRDLRPPTR
jgi:hypothetical protein